MQLKYHQPTFDLIEREPIVDLAAVALLDQCEAAYGFTFPESVREWYSLAGSVEVLREYSNQDDVLTLSQIKEVAYDRHSYKGAFDFHELSVLDLNRGKPRRDFTPKDVAAFHHTTDKGQAWDWAWSRHPDDPAVLYYKVPKDQMATLRGKMFLSGDSEWESMVKQGRAGTLEYGEVYDYVSGPLWRNYPHLPPLAEGDQTTIFTRAAVDIFNRFLQH